MKRSVTVFLLLTVLIGVLFAQNEGDFIFDGKGTITGYQGWDDVVVIPAMIGGVPVTAIARSAFRNMGLTSVIIPANIKYIGFLAFADNKLTSITLPAGVTVAERAFFNNNLINLSAGDEAFIGRSAFSRNRLTTLTLGDKIFIDQNAFENNALKDLFLGTDIIFRENDFGRFLFYEYMCNDRKAGIFNTSITYTSKREGDFEFYLIKNMAVIARYFGDDVDRLIIPRQLGGMPVKGIAHDGSNGAFNKKNISRMLLPDGIIFIGSNAFKENRLESVTIPGSVIYIGDSAFSQNRLTSVNISVGVTFIGEQSFRANQLASVNIPDGVLYIDASSFFSNRLTSVIIPSSVFNIGDKAFEANLQLASVTIGADVELAPESFGMLSIFPRFYSSSGRRAGTYVLNNRQWILQ